MVILFILYLWKSYAVLLPSEKERQLILKCSYLYVPLLLRDTTTALDFLVKIKTHNIVEDENMPFIQINDKDLKKKTTKYWGGQYHQRKRDNSYLNEVIFII